MNGKQSLTVAPGTMYMQSTNASANWPGLPSAVAMDGMLPSSICPVCGENDPKVYLQGPARELSHASLGSSRTSVSPGQILRCRNCRLAFSAERSTQEDLSLLYQEMDVRVYESELRGRAKTAARHLDIVKKYCSGGSLLDIGCASGLFLERAAQGGWKVTGVEPSETLYERAKEKLANQGEVICATLQNSLLPSASFDVLTAWDVLEHVPDPLEFVRACAALLRDGGYLIVNVPDIDSLPARILGTRWPLLLPEHLNYFNRKSLRLCGERAGFACLHFGRRMASFSIGYVLLRLGQHRIPGVTLMDRLARITSIDEMVVPVPLGELWCVWRKLPASETRA
jgi:SAM-dependent methyltransferase